MGTALVFGIRRLAVAVAALLAFAALGACAKDSVAGAPATTPSSSSSPVSIEQIALTGRIPAEQRDALLRLAAASPPLAAEDAPHAPAALAVALTAAEQSLFDQQVALARDAAARYATPAAAAADGYTQSSAQVPGIGVHWVKWSLVDQSFDPAHPSMLLFDDAPSHQDRLAGLSYWVRSAEAPDGFAGPNDVWHRHRGMCFEDGWLQRESVADASQCGGQWLGGADLWMLHVWVAPEVPNVDGVFAPRNNALCPADWQQVPDTQRCSAGPGSPAPRGTHGDPDAPLAPDTAYCHLGT